MLLLACSPCFAIGAAAPGRAVAVGTLSAPEALRQLQALRRRGCDGHAGMRLPLREPQALQRAAVGWAAGAPLEVAIEAAGYRAERSKALQYRGGAEDFPATLRQRLCEALTQPQFRDVGVYSRGGTIWILLAVPFAAPSPEDASSVRQQLLEGINAARAHARRCGSQTYGAVPPLQMNAHLNQAAERHARDMLEHDFFGHRGSDGSMPSARVLAAGYRFHRVGENIAEGAETVQEALQGWLHSPEHCANIMDPHFRQTGFAYTVNARGAPRIYWVEDFGTPAH